MFIGPPFYEWDGGRERLHRRNFMANIKATFIADYWSHETTDIVTITQEFEGASYEEIAQEYFGIWGDELARLTHKGSGLVVFDRMAQVLAYADEVGYCI